MLSCFRLTSAAVWCLFAVLFHLSSVFSLPSSSVIFFRRSQLLASAPLPHPHSVFPPIAKDLINLWVRTETQCRHWQRSRREFTLKRRKKHIHDHRRWSGAVSAQPQSWRELGSLGFMCQIWKIWESGEEKFKILCMKSLSIEFRVQTETSKWNLSAWSLLPLNVSILWS